MKNRLAWLFGIPIVMIGLVGVASYSRTRNLLDDDDRLTKPELPAAAPDASASLDKNAPSPEFPSLTQPVNDFAHVLAVSQANDIDGEIRKLFESTGVVLVLATVETCKPLDMKQCSLAVFSNHGQGIGQRGRDNGILLLLAVKDQSVRITTGSGMEKIIPDPVAQEIVVAMVPAFRKGDYDTGLRDGVRMLIQRIGTSQHQH